MDREHLSAAIAVISSEARLAECLVRASRGNEWVADAGGWLDDIDCALDRARMRLQRMRSKTDSQTGG